MSKNSIFNFSGTESPLGDWMESNRAQVDNMRLDRLIAYRNLPISQDQEVTFQSRDYFIYNNGTLFLVRNLDYAEKDKKVLWCTPARSGNGKYLNKPEHADKKYDKKTNIGGPIPEGWFYMPLNDFTSNKNSGNVKKGQEYKGYQPNRNGGAWGAWAKPLYKWYWDSNSVYGRNGFFLHEDGNEDNGGKAVGSGGCIACTKKDGGVHEVAKFVKQAYDLGIGDIWVYVDYDYSPPVTYENYKVKERDNLYRLGLKFGVTIEAIKKANGLKSDLIKKNEVLRIPKSSCL